MDMIKAKDIHIEEKDNIKQKIICAVILGIVVVAYNLIYLNKTLPITDGWHKYYVELIKDGYFPYRDFYYYLPPLNMLTDYIFWSLSGDSFLIYRLWRLLERVLMMELLYCMLNKKFSAANSCLACAVGAVLGTACGYDLNGDYNQTEILLFILLGFVTYKYFDAQSNKGKGLYMILAGIIAGMMFLLKQSTFVAAGIVFAIVFFMLCFIQKDKKHYRYIAHVILGCVLPIVVCFMVLLYNHALSEFFFQVYGDTSSKGSLFDILVGSQIKLSIENLYQIMLAICIVLYIYYKKCNDKKINFLKRIILLSVATLTGYLYFDKVTSFFATDMSLFGWFLLLLSCVPILIYMLFRINDDMNDMIFYIISLILSGTILVNNIYNIAEIIYTESSLFSSIVNIVTLFFYILVMLIIVNLLLQFLRKGEPLFSEHILMMCSIGVASGYATTMASGVAKAVESRSAYIIVPVTICLLYDYVEKNTKKVLLLGCFLLCLGCISQKATNTYSWWGNNTGKLSDKVFTVNNEALKGFKFTVDEARKYEEVINLIEKNSTEDAVVYGFPHMKIFNILTNRYIMNGFVPVPFYDVCTDKFAREEAVYLAMNNPDIIIWCDIQYCLEYHEEIFRDGEELGQRDIQRWFISVKDESYELIGQIDNLFIYKLKNDMPTRYTYFENPSKENATASVDLIVNQSDNVDVQNSNYELSFAGEGTFDRPYLVQNVKDLKRLQEYVNSGINFEGKYFKQTANIEWNKGEEWTPIGIMGSGNYFAGTYNGNGNIINNILIQSKGENVGFFGQLEGTVMNLSLTNISVNGVCCGGITSHGYGEPKIINCYVDGEIVATGRAGGIADNFCGKIINCVSNCTLIAPVVGDIVSYDAIKIENCYNLSQHEDIKSIENKLNTNLQVMKKYTDGIICNKWSVEDDEIVILAEKYIGTDFYMFEFVVIFVIGMGVLVKNVIIRGFVSKSKR